MPVTAASSGSFLITPNVGLMIWTLLLFGISMYVLAKLAFPRITAALDRRQKAIEESIDHAEQIRHQADELLAEYRERLAEARSQADGIVARARRAAEVHERDALDEIHDQLTAFADAMHDNRQFAVFFFSPYFSVPEKEDGLQRAVENANPAFMNFLQALIERHRMPAIFRIRDEFEALWVH